MPDIIERVMHDIILSTLNARYIHSALGLRYLLANMGPLRGNTQILEYNINLRPLDIVENILAHQPKIIGFGVYIWNVEQTTQVIRIIKYLCPEIVIIVGGPEVSFEWAQQQITNDVDYLITGAADFSFRHACISLLDGSSPPSKIIHSDYVDPKELALPYPYYTEEDIANRVIYVEASRGCPFKCEFCLSALDKTAVPFDLDLFLSDLQDLYDRGARQFKFVDRTFNLKATSSARILKFFLDKETEDIFLHFELIPDHLPEQLKELIVKFPLGSLQFEIGVQTLNNKVQQLISRKQNNDKTTQSLTWIKQQSYAHIHADLIAGLPGEDLASFAQGFDYLVSLKPHEIQVGILKRLRGTPIIRHTLDYEMKFNPYPPYNILSNKLIDFDTMQRLNRFARYWDMIANSGRFTHSISLILGDSPFANFMRLSDWLFAKTAQTHKLALSRLFTFLHQGMMESLQIDEQIAEQQLSLDFAESGIKGRPSFSSAQTIKTDTGKKHINRRQKQHSTKAKFQTQP